jgi:predicted phage terminase large subunit-like protein
MKIPENKKIAGINFISQKLIEARRLLGKDFLKFRKYYFKTYHEFPDADFHKELSSLLMKMTKKRKMKAAIAAPRDSAKSTIISLEYVLYCICHKLENYIVIISNTREQASSFLRDIKHELDSNERLRQDFPEVCDRQVKPKPAPWKETEIITPNKVKVTALGTDQEIRGRRNMKDRPTLIILDDIETSEPIQNPENINKLEDWLTKSVLKSGTNITNIIFIGTIHHYDSLLAKFTGDTEYPGWEKRIYRSIISEPERLDLWDQWRRILNRKEFYKGKDGKDGAECFFEDNKKEMIKGTKVLWPARKSYHDLMLQREDEGSFSFDAEMQNDPVNRRDCMFPPEDIHYWDDMYKTEEELLAFLNSRGCVAFFGACDPSMGKENMRGDRSAIITIAKDYTDNKMYILDADIAIRKPDIIYSDIFIYHAKRHYSMFGFETNQAQHAMALDLQRRAMDAGLMLNIFPINTTLHKITRIQGLQPYIKGGEILFSRRHYPLLDEMSKFPRGRFKDGLDALHMAVEVGLNTSFGMGGCPQAFQGNAGNSDVLGNEPDLRYTNFPQVHKEKKDRFVPDPDDY